MAGAMAGGIKAPGTAPGRRWRAARAMAAAVLWIAVHLASATAVAQPRLADDLPLLLTADAIDYDEALGQVTARGNVEIVQADRILLADTISYNQKTKVVTASGNISLLEPSGEVFFADYVELSDNLADGIAENLRLLLTDQSRFAAVGARRSGGTVTEMRKAVFSPCKLCEDDPTAAPLWQIRAARVTHDKTAQEIEYRDAVLEFFGVPVAYTPYFSHPDPTVKRRSGFLAPHAGFSDDLGFVAGIPYFWAIGPDKDATVEPTWTTDQGPVMAGEYRQRFTAGEFEIAGSFTQSDLIENEGETSKKRFRGHVRSRTRFDIDDFWRAGADIARTTDDTYLRRYDFGSENVLTSNAFVEGFWGRSYAAANAFAFQGLRTRDSTARTPLILPQLDYNFVGEPRRSGDYVTIDANLLSLTRDEGADSHRLSLDGGWHLPYVAPAGDIYSLSATLRGDLYMVDDVTKSGGGTHSGAHGRLFPQVAGNWRYPFIRQTGTVQQTVEPMLGVVVAPSGGNPEAIPNEDSQDIEFDDTNLFSANRFTGLDRVEGGTRLVYGLNLGLLGMGGGSSTAFVGQSYRLRDESAFRPGSGLDESLSDYVTRLQVSPGDYMDLLWRTRLDKDDFVIRRNEILTTAGVPEFRLHADYVYADGAEATQEFGKREQIAFGASSQFSRYWSISAAMRRDLAQETNLSQGVALTYADECFVMTTTVSRTFTRDRDIAPSDTIMFRFVFKHLGEATTRSQI